MARFRLYRPPGTDPLWKWFVTGGVVLALGVLLLIAAGGLADDLVIAGLFTVYAVRLQAELRARRRR
jgi:hypothetical protein